MVQLHFADNVPQRGGAEIFNGGNGVFHAVSVKLGIGDLEIDHSIDLHSHIILGDHRLRREINDLLLQAHLPRDAIQKGNFHMQARSPCGMERAQPLHHKGVCLRNDLDIGDDDRQHKDHQHRDHKNSGKSF